MVLGWLRSKTLLSHFHIESKPSIILHKQKQSQKNPNKTSNISHSIHYLIEFSIIGNSRLTPDNKNRSWWLISNLYDRLHSFCHLIPFPTIIIFPRKHTLISDHNILIDTIDIFGPSIPLKYILCRRNIVIKWLWTTSRIGKHVQDKSLNNWTEITIPFASQWIWVTLYLEFNITIWIWSQLIPS